ncbi:doubled CXXCH motif [bacterium BMS3Abin07]|nr:doubled CXXCH motif [bacterium BMS3Abin07]GBE33404.1 doubled CXXCH motif [bacterium BMS3Bbin05]
MIARNFVKILIMAASVLALVAPSWSADYIGSDACFKCHPSQYNDFKVSGHPYKLQKADTAKFWPLPLPRGYSWDDISYVIGGAYKKSRYIDKKGYIITAAKDGSDLKTQYNIETGTWSYYHKGQKKPYKCGPCHMTAYSKKGHQDGLEGMIGTWKFPGVQCEECHGPGSDHAKSAGKKKMKVDASAAACGKCHVRGNPKKVPAKGGFIRHHEQYPELLAGAHKSLDCVTCHNPHKKYKFSIKRQCATCHASQASAFRGSIMEKVGVACIDCHMPRATKSATAKGKYEGDIRTHLFKINADAKASMFYSEKVKGKKKTFARGFVTSDFACLNCHKNRNRKWAEAKAKGIHSYSK